MGATVLVVEDERKLRDLVRSYLERAGFSVLSTGSGAEAITMASGVVPDLVVLDLGLPDVPGEAVARELRAVAATPILMLTAKTTEEDRIRGLELGADDYVTKPFSPRELVLRAQAILRRGGPAADQGVTGYGGGELVIDEPRRAATVRGAQAELTPTEWGILVALATVPGRVYSRFELINRVRGYEFEGYERTVDSHVKNLRRKIESDPASPAIIQTVLGGGYRLGLARDALRAGGSVRSSRDTLGCGSRWRSSPWRWRRSRCWPTGGRAGGRLRLRRRLVAGEAAQRTFCDVSSQATRPAAWTPGAETASSAMPTGSLEPDSPSSSAPPRPATSRRPLTEKTTAGSVGASAAPSSSATPSPCRRPGAPRPPRRRRWPTSRRDHCGRLMEMGRWLFHVICTGSAAGLHTRLVSYGESAPARSAGERTGRRRQMSADRGGAMDMQGVPTLAGVHHLKLPVTDLARSREWYHSRLGYEVEMEFIEHGTLMGYALAHPNGGPVLGLRLDPDRARAAAGFDYFAIGVPGKAAIDELAARLTALGDDHAGVHVASRGWILPQLHDPDGHEVRFYTIEHHTDPQAPGIATIHDPRENSERREREYHAARTTPGTG